MNYGIVSQEQIEKIDSILTDKLIKLGVDCVIVIDMAGNIITAKDNGESKYDVHGALSLTTEWCWSRAKSRCTNALRNSAFEGA